MIPSFLQDIDWGTSLIVIAMAIVAFVLVTHFMEGGVKKGLTLLVIVVTAGLGLYFVNRGGKGNKHRRNFEEATRAFEKAKAEREQAEMKIRVKEERIKRLSTQADDQEESINSTLSELDELKKTRVDASADMARLEMELAENKEKLAVGYKPASSGNFLEELQRRVKEGGNVSTVADPSPVRGEVMIDVEQDGFRLKGDIS